LNEYRVRDAQRLLAETNAPIQNIFEESGFNSITSFNRVFKELAGEAPKEYRARHKA
jgi:two-component system response regulator YesN